MKSAGGSRSPTLKLEGPSENGYGREFRPAMCLRARFGVLGVKVSSQQSKARRLRIPNLNEARTVR